MSGSGSSYIPTRSTEFNCDSSVITTTVSSIDLVVLSKHKVGDILEVVLSIKESLVLEDGDGEILGSIVHINTSDIIDCIKKGALYVAEIISINSPACRVQIKRK